MLALCQLIQLRDYYNDDWVPDWNTFSAKYCVSINCNNIDCTVNISINRVLAFKTKELMGEFVKNFKDLIEIAKPLL